MHDALDDESPFVANIRTLVSLAIIVLVGAVASSSGVGGGAIFIPLFNALVGFNLKSSTALSQACITFGAAATLLANLMHHHPSDPRVALVDFTLVAVLTPMLLMGVGIGVLLNVMLPSWLLTTLLLLLLTALVAQSLNKGRALWLQENVLRRYPLHHQQQSQGQQQVHTEQLPANQEAVVVKLKRERSGGDCWREAGDAAALRQPLLLSAKRGGGDAAADGSLAAAAAAAVASPRSCLTPAPTAVWIDLEEADGGSGHGGGSTAAVAAYGCAPAGPADVPFDDGAGAGDGELQGITMVADTDYPVDKAPAAAAGSGSGGDGCHARGVHGGLLGMLPPRQLHLHRQPQQAIGGASGFRSGTVSYKSPFLPPSITERSADVVPNAATTATAGATAAPLPPQAVAAFAEALAAALAAAASSTPCTTWSSSWVAAATSLFALAAPSWRAFNELGFVEVDEDDHHDDDGDDDGADSDDGCRHYQPPYPLPPSQPPPPSVLPHSGDGDAGNLGTQQAMMVVVVESGNGDAQTSSSPGGVGNGANLPPSLHTPELREGIRPAVLPSPPPPPPSGLPPTYSAALPSCHMTATGQSYYPYGSLNCGIIMEHAVINAAAAECSAQVSTAVMMAAEGAVAESDAAASLLQPLLQRHHVPGESENGKTTTILFPERDDVASAAAAAAAARNAVDGSAAGIVGAGNKGSGDGIRAIIPVTAPLSAAPAVTTTQRKARGAKSVVTVDGGGGFLGAVVAAFRRVPPAQVVALAVTWGTYFGIQYVRSHVSRCSPLWWGLTASQALGMAGLSIGALLVATAPPLPPAPAIATTAATATCTTKYRVVSGAAAVVTTAAASMVAFFSKRRRQSTASPDDVGGAAAAAAGSHGSGDGGDLVVSISNSNDESAPLLGRLPGTGSVASAVTSAQLPQDDLQRQQLSIVLRTPAAVLAVTCAAGLAGGLLGMGGGMVMGPMMLHLGLHPQVTAATSGTMVLFSSSAALAQFALLGRLNLPYAVVFGAASAAASAVGSQVLSRAVRRSGRPSLVVLALAAVMAGGAICVAVYGLWEGIEEIQMRRHGGGAGAGGDDIGPRPGGLAALCGWQ